MIFRILPNSQPIRTLSSTWQHRIERYKPQFARLICRLIPSQCPFARRITFRGRTLLEIPPLCKLNPFYDRLMELRFHSLSFLADVCGEDTAKYC